MIGAIIGDIVGSRFEFSKAPEKNFDFFTSECNFTDDTICTIAIADAILHNKPYQKTLHEWCRRYPKSLGMFGRMFRQWIESDDPQPYNSFGNGSAMRVSSVGWLFKNVARVMEESRRTALVSHSHPEGIKGAQCVAALVFWLRTCRITKSEVAGIVKSNFGYEIPPLKDIMRIGRERHFDGTCQETVPYAIRCFLESVDFEDAIRIAVACGGDTDTKANLTGAIAEAYYEVPDTMVERAYGYLPNEMLDVMEEFYAAMLDIVSSE